MNVCHEEFACSDECLSTIGGRGGGWGGSFFFPFNKVKCELKMHEGRCVSRFLTVLSASGSDFTRGPAAVRHLGSYLRGQTAPWAPAAPTGRRSFVCCRTTPGTASAPADSPRCPLWTAAESSTGLPARGEKNGIRTRSYGSELLPC